jgi:hypothetical protein
MEKWDGRGGAEMFSRRATKRQCEAAGAGWLGSQIEASDSALRTSSSLEVGRDGRCDDVKRVDGGQAVRRRYVHLFAPKVFRPRKGSLSRHTHTGRAAIELRTGVRMCRWWSRDKAGVVVRKRAAY